MDTVVIVGMLVLGAILHAAASRLGWTGHDHSMDAFMQEQARQQRDMAAHPERYGLRSWASWTGP